MDINVIKEKLTSINWNFDFTINYDDTTIRPFNCRKYFSYPATFIPEIPYTLIDILSKKGDVVLDPFGGVGTTFMQALLLERQPYSYDINPIASDVCDVLYHLFDPLLNYTAIQNDLLNIIEDYDVNINYSLLLSDERKELIGWYEKETFNKISFLFNKFDDLNHGIVTEIFKLVLSSLLTTLSSQNKGWAYIADNVKPKADELKSKPVFDYFKTAIKTLFKDVMEQKKSLSLNFSEFYCQVAKSKRVFNDTLINNTFDDNTVDLVVTSPPYPRMIDYIKSQRLSFSFEELNFKDYVENEIGARYRRTRQNTLEKYKQEMAAVNNHIERLLKPGAFLCLVLPDYKNDDDRKPIIEEIVKSYEGGFELISKIGRYIPSHKRTLSIQWASLVNENIYIYQKRGC
ncbi:MAG: site-specific DNA-methyltransferase [Oscillospiraceae bacterium]|jgi:DNA modification methylase|nr:site-specific DNA-methyltransferase [Oscillospiraceae bacterium]